MDLMTFVSTCYVVRPMRSSYAVKFAKTKAVAATRCGIEWVDRYTDCGLLYVTQPLWGAEGTLNKVEFVLQLLCVANTCSHS